MSEHPEREWITKLLAVIEAPFVGSVEERGAQVFDQDEARREVIPLLVAALSESEADVERLRGALENAPQPATDRHDPIYELWWQDRNRALSPPEKPEEGE